MVFLAAGCNPVVVNMSGGPQLVRFQHFPLNGGHPNTVEDTGLNPAAANNRSECKSLGHRLCMLGEYDGFKLYRCLYGLY
jgi:hypothetical protein